MSRHTTRSAIVATLRTALATASAEGTQIQVEPGWPGDQIRAESVWLESSDGEVRVPYFHGQPNAGNPLTRHDEYTVPVQIQAGAAGQTFDVAEARAQALYDLIDAALAAAPQPGNPDHFLEATTGEVNGPATGRMANGAVSFYRVVINVKERTT